MVRLLWNMVLKGLNYIIFLNIYFQSRNLKIFILEVEYIKFEVRFAKEVQFTLKLMIPKDGMSVFLATHVIH